MVFWLNGAGMDAIQMQSLAYIRSDRHEIMIPRGHDVYRCDDLGF